MRLILALFLFTFSGYAEVVYPGFSLIPHIADGGGIQTEITLTNLDDTPSTATVWFWDDSGNTLPIVMGPGDSTNFTLAPHASRTIRTAGTASSQTQGWASITTTSNVGASAIFRVSVAPWTGAEVVIPADPTRNNRFSLAFDQTNSSVMGLALVNPLNNPIQVTMTFRGEDGGVIVTDTFNMGSRTHKAIAATSSYPVTTGRRGTIEISTTGAFVSVLALRFGPSTIRSVVPLVSHSWSDTDNYCWGCWDY